MKYTYFFETKLGRIGIAENGSAITNVFFGKTVVPTHFEVKETPLLKKAAFQIHEYLDGNRKVFDLPLCMEGTAFQQRVWNALLTIPFGEKRSYGQVAEQVGNPKASRAVGRANGLNPISIFIPCHRVIGANGKLVGYAGGLEIKERLLELERR